MVRLASVTPVNFITREDGGRTSTLEGLNDDRDLLISHAAKSQEQPFVVSVPNVVVEGRYRGHILLEESQLRTMTETQNASARETFSESRPLNEAHGQQHTATLSESATTDSWPNRTVTPDVEPAGAEHSFNHHHEYFDCDDLGESPSIRRPSDISISSKPAGDMETPPGSLTAPLNPPFKRSLRAVAGTSQFTPPTSSAATQTTNTAASLTAASSVASSASRNHVHLYSAIGSLEDPSTSNNSWAPKKPGYEFRSASLIPSEKPNRARNKGVSKGVVLTTSERKSEKRPKQSQLSATMSAMESTAKAEEAQVTKKLGGEDSVQTSTETAKADQSLEKSDQPTQIQPQVSNLRKDGAMRSDKKVTIAPDQRQRPSGRKKKTPVEMFRPSSDAYTPRMGKKQIKYKPAEMRTPVQQMASPLGTLSRPNFRDALRRVAMIIRQHIVKIENRFENQRVRRDDGLFSEAMKNQFAEENYATPVYKCTMVRVPMARPGMVVGLKRIRVKAEIPSENDIYEFAHQLFKAVQLSSECSIVCLIYIERLMEVAKVPLMANTWRPIFMCGLLLASKVWQDLSSWNIEFASVYPQYSLDSINRLELLFLRKVKWDLYISSSLYAKYYFALRSIVAKDDFRQRYNRMVGGVGNVQASEALKIEKRSTMVKEEALMQLSRSM